MLNHAKPTGGCCMESHYKGILGVQRAGSHLRHEFTGWAARPFRRISLKAQVIRHHPTSEARVQHPMADAKTTGANEARYFVADPGACHVEMIWNDGCSWGDPIPCFLKRWRMKAGVLFIFVISYIIYIHILYVFKFCFYEVSRLMGSGVRWTPQEEKFGPSECCMLVQTPLPTFAGI